jgi:DNA-binding transcriptional LysR family regulator
MEFRHLRYFVAVAESLHFGEAARRLRIAQPSLSQQIRQLETELQTTLLRRTKRRVELTEAGRLFFDEATDLLARRDRAALIARRAGRADGGRLRVSAGYCMDQVAIVRALSAFNAHHPNFRVELQTTAVQSQIAALRDERVDVGFVRSTNGESFLESEVLVREPLLVAMPRGHRLATKKALQLSMLADQPFVVTSRDLVPAYHDIVLRMCREAGFVPNAAHESDHLHVLLAFVGAGCGVALVPAFARTMRPARVAFVALRPSVPVLETVIAWRKSAASAALTDFVSIARRALAIAQRRAVPAHERT